MTDPTLITALVLAGLFALATMSLAALKAWQGWLKLQRLGIEAGRATYPASSYSPVARIEIADLKERVRRLEAIADGIIS